MCCVFKSSHLVTTFKTMYNLFSAVCCMNHWCMRHSSCGPSRCAVTSICRGRLSQTVRSSVSVGFSLHMSTSSRSMSPLIRSPLATRPILITPHKTPPPVGPLLQLLPSLRRRKHKTPSTHMQYLQYTQSWSEHKTPKYLYPSCTYFVLPSGDSSALVSVSSSCVLDEFDWLVWDWSNQSDTCLRAHSTVETRLCTASSSSEEG